MHFSFKLKINMYKKKKKENNFREIFLPIFDWKAKGNFLGRRSDCGLF